MVDPPMQDSPQASVPSAVVLTERVISSVASTLRDLHPDEPGLPPVTLDSQLDQDLGFDSLGRMELWVRLERAFGISLPADTLQSAERVSDLLDAVRQAATSAPAGWVDSGPADLRSQSARADQPASAETASTLLEVLQAHLQAHPEQTQVVVLQDGGEQAISYRQLADAASRVAAGLQQAGVVPRQSVAIMLPTSAEYFSTYFGILMAGAIPVPIYPPARPSQLEDHVLRHAGILDNAQAVVLVTVETAMGVARLLQARVPVLRQVITPQRLMAAGNTPTPVPVHADDIAFIQYTSGSTGNPKGVVLTHANLLANIRAMARVTAATPRDVFVSWLPLYHDMGLIGAWLSSVYVGFPLVVMSPLAFLSRPLRWLQAIHHWHGTLAAGPNFAYELCLKRIDDAALQQLDLSRWRLAFNGAEAVSPDTVRRFSQRFARCGLRAEAMAPVYGLAEASVGLLFPPLGRVAPVDVICREPFTREGRALLAVPDEPDPLRFVACGRPLPGHRVRILDAAGREVGERVEGRLEFRGPSATRGYFRNPEQTRKLLHDGWLDTGDRAYRADGDIYITGRAKDIVIRGGRNLYPHEIEEVVGRVAGVRNGCVAVFGSPDPLTGTERLVVLAETRPAGLDAMACVREAVSRAVIDAIGEPADEILLAMPHTVLKTSSGKIRRSACRDLYESGRIGKAVPGARRQVLRLALGSILLRLRHGLRHLYALYAALLFWLLAPCSWLLSQLMPTPASVWALNRGVARALFVLTATPLKVSGLEHLPKGPCVLVSNHASYLDGAILVAALPRPFAFVAKQELREQFIAGHFLRRMGAVFVERFDVQRSVDDAEKMGQAVLQGHSLAVFPEGTFRSKPGLLPFRLGAFLAAARAGVPLVPVAIRGAREVLPDGSRWPQHGSLEVEVCAPIQPMTEAPDLFAAAVSLREAAVQVLARNTGER